MSLAESIREELGNKTAFFVGRVSISEATVVTWMIMAIIVLLSAVLTRKLKIDHISRRQALAEFAVTKLETVVGNMVGERGESYVPYLITVLLYLGLSNIAHAFGFRPPTKTLNVTASLALMSIVLVQVAGIRARGLKGWLKAFAEPIGIMVPFRLLDLFTRPLSLCMRLFGNILASFVIMTVLESVVPVVAPAMMGLYFDFFDGILHAYVFVFLTGMYIREAAGGAIETSFANTAD